MGHIAWDPATSTTATMNTFLFFSTLVAFSRAATVAVAPGAVAPVAVAAPASFLVRALAHDSASIEHHRLGGNFAYSTAEAHAFAEVSPQISPISLLPLSRQPMLPSASSRTSPLMDVRLLLAP